MSTASCSASTWQVLPRTATLRSRDTSKTDAALSVLFPDTHEVLLRALLRPMLRSCAGMRLPASLVYKPIPRELRPRRCGQAGNKERVSGCAEVCLWSSVANKNQQEGRTCRLWAFDTFDVKTLDRLHSLTAFEGEEQVREMLARCVSWCISRHYREIWLTNRR
jgi:hypothetical protein